MDYLNIDTIELAKSTNYPFTLASTKTINDRLLPDTLFISLHICVGRPCALLYLALLKLLQQTVVVFIRDKDRNLVFRFYLCLHSVNSFIWNLLDAPCGIVQYNMLLYTILFQLLLLSLDNTILIPSSSFVLLPYCVSVLLTLGGPAQITLNGRTLYNRCIDLLNGLHYQEIHGLSDSYISFYTLTDVPATALSGLCYVNGESVAGKHVIIKHNTLSDLRVVTDSNIKLLGVADV